MLLDNNHIMASRPVPFVSEAIDADVPSAWETSCEHARRWAQRDATRKSSIDSVLRRVALVCFVLDLVALLIAVA